MLISKTAIIKWNPKIQKHYVDLGYIYTKQGDEFEVNVKDLTCGSNALITFECDYCYKQFQRMWYRYNDLRRKAIVSKDCCEQCLQLKAKESVYKKYGVDNANKVPEIQEKAKQTNLQKYGCENPFGNELVKEKIRQTLLERYGVEKSSQIPGMSDRIRQTCLEKYGVINYGIIWSREHKGELSPVWKGDQVIHKRLIRGQPEYREWRKSVFDRDLYTCKCCGARNGNGKYIRLEAHHITS